MRQPTRCSRPWIHGSFALAALWMGGQAQALVPVTPADIVGVGVMSASCASLLGSGNGLNIAGAIDDGLFAAGTSCSGQAVNGAVGSASSQAAFSNPKATATAQGQASLGVLHLGSQLDTPGGIDAARFPLAISQAGFGDTLTINSVGKQGQAGLLQVAVHASGVLDASGNAGSAAFVLDVTKNDQLMFNGQGASQSRVWAAASFPVPGPLSEHVVVNETVTFGIPFTFGTSFEMVVLGESIAASRSQTGGAHSASDFSHTVWWAGVQSVTANGAAVTGYTIDSLSGTDWTHAAAVPEPSTGLLLAAGLGLIGGLGRTKLRARRRDA